MDTLRVVGQVAGIGGIALGVFVVLFRDFIRKVIQDKFPTLTKNQAYQISILTLLLIWSIAVAGIIAWVMVERPTETGSAESSTDSNTEEKKVWHKNAVRIATLRSDLIETQPEPSVAAKKCLDLNELELSTEPEIERQRNAIVDAARANQNCDLMLIRALVGTINDKAIDLGIVPPNP